ncbi:MAG: sigma-70 family RNA polymerase sigma factor [Deltaproteobacteria bacterium]|nr:sigma-70 family RNA polymerase sigma factor [Deltaproteobacteria bacterium]
MPKQKTKKLTVAKSPKSLVRADPLSQFIQEASKYPLLTAEEEKKLAIAFHTKGDVEAARKLVTAHLRLVIKIALEYRQAYYNVLDLIQEGNVGLMYAVKKYDPAKGARFSYYASWWVRSFILKYILDNFRLIKIGTTKDQKKLYYNLIL